MRSGTVRDHNDANNLHKAQKNLTKRVAALEAVGVPKGHGASVQPLKAALERVEQASKARDDSLRGQILALRSQVAKLQERLNATEARAQEPQETLEPRDTPTKG